MYFLWIHFIEIQQSVMLSAGYVTHPSSFISAWDWLLKCKAHHLNISFCSFELYDLRVHLAIRGIFLLLFFL